MNRGPNQLIHGVMTRRLMGDADANEYRRLVEMVPDFSLIAELGVFDGGSLLSIADIVKRKNLDVVVADIFNQPMTANFNPRGQMLGSKESFVGNMAQAGLGLLAVLGTSKDLVKWFADTGRKPELIFIDADHSYEGVSRDINLLWPCVAPLGVICGHDFYDEHPGIKKAVLERFPDCFVQQGTGVWSCLKT